MSSSGKFIAGLLAGAAAGAILGILFAPDKGSETRKKLAEKGSDLADTIKSKSGEYADIVSEKYEKVKEKVMGEGKDLYNQAKEKVNSAKSEFTASMNS
jgi:gas vesicle protein